MPKVTGLLTCRSTTPCNANVRNPDYDPTMDKTRYKMDVGWRLGVAIEAVGVSKASVARTLGLPQQNISNWLRGDHYPDAFFVYKFCKRYGISADWIYLGEVSGISSTELADGLWARASASSASKSAPALQESEKD